MYGVMNELEGKSHLPTIPWRKKKTKPKRCDCCRRCCVGLLHLLRRARATGVILMATLSVPGFYMTHHMFLSPGLATYTSRLHPSVCTVVSSTILKGKTNCSWASCREGCTETDLFQCWQVLVVPYNITANLTTPASNISPPTRPTRVKYDCKKSKRTGTSRRLLEDDTKDSTIKLPYVFTKSKTVSAKHPPTTPGQSYTMEDGIQNSTIKLPFFDFKRSNTTFTSTQHNINDTDTTLNTTEYNIQENARNMQNNTFYDYETEPSNSPSPSLSTPNTDSGNGSSSLEDDGNMEDGEVQTIPSASNVKDVTVVQLVPGVNNNNNNNAGNTEGKDKSTTNQDNLPLNTNRYNSDMLRLVVNIVGCGYMSCFDWWAKYGQVGSVHTCFLNADRTLAIPEVDYKAANAQIVFGVFPLIMIFASFTIVYFSYCRQGNNKVFPMSPKKDIKKLKFEEAKMALLLKRVVEQNTKTNLNKISPMLVKEAMKKAKNQQEGKSQQIRKPVVGNVKRAKNPEVIISVAG
ncbi:hypothetical protein Pmani_024966 [Petrolisthes manimaculis]|uniref:Uncharacterized protein n=1 Tax=Petrolisthes manimaculis TaxID=1843537 RepID=A0AAE1U1N1_9EUCA|nr:hypothetical protein Pmani_024966 [Petrolisthes manimaculis]